MASRFEILVERKIREIGEGMFNAPLGDSHTHAYIKGQRVGLDIAKALYAKAQQEDPDDD